MDQNTDNKRNFCIVVHLHDPINNSCSSYAGNAYNEIMLQTFWHIAAGN